MCLLLPPWNRCDSTIKQIPVAFPSFYLLLPAINSSWRIFTKAFRLPDRPATKGFRHAKAPPGSCCLQCDRYSTVAQGKGLLNNARRMGLLNGRKPIMTVLWLRSPIIVSGTKTYLFGLTATDAESNKLDRRERVMNDFSWPFKIVRLAKYPKQLSCKQRIEETGKRNADPSGRQNCL